MNKYTEVESLRGAFQKLENNHNWFVRRYGNIMQKIGAWIVDQGVKYGDMYKYVGREGRNPND
jgi:hypothetical protein